MRFVDNLLNNKTNILLNLVEYRLILANSAYGLIGEVSGDIPHDVAGLLLIIRSLQSTLSKTYTVGTEEALHAK